MKNTPVKDIMSTALMVLSPYDTLTSAKIIFDENRIHHIPVIEEGKLVGILSNTDIERSKQGKSLFINHNIDEHNATILEVTLVNMVMTEMVESVDSSDSLSSVYQVFKQNRFRALPVFQDGDLAGIVTPMDFLDFFFSEK